MLGLANGAFKNEKPPPEKETAFFLPLGYAQLGAFTFQSETSHAEEHEKPARRLRDCGPVGWVLCG